VQGAHSDSNLSNSLHDVNVSVLITSTNIFVTTEKKNLFAYLFVFPFQQGTKLVILEENAASIAIVVHSVLRSRKKSVY